MIKRQVALKKNDLPHNILFSIVVDQTAYQDDFPLIICQLSKCYSKWNQSALFYHIAGNAVGFLFHCLADFREEQVITVYKRKITGRDQVWKRSTDKQVGTVEIGSG